MPSQQPTHPKPLETKNQPSDRSQCLTNLGHGRCNSSCETGALCIIGKATIVEAVTSPSHKSEAPPLPLNTSSQASMEEGRLLLRVSHAHVSPTVQLHTAATVLVHWWTSQNFRTDANLAADHMLSVKRSMDLKRQ